MSLVWDIEQLGEWVKHGEWLSVLFYYTVFSQTVVQVDPKFLRNMRFAKKHNKKHLKQKVWVDSTLWLSGALLCWNWSVFCAYGIALLTALLWLNAVLYFCAVVYAVIKHQYTKGIVHKGWMHKVGKNLLSLFSVLVHIVPPALVVCICSQN